MRAKTAPLPRTVSPADFHFPADGRPAPEEPAFFFESPHRIAFLLAPFAYPPAPARGRRMSWTRLTGSNPRRTGASAPYQKEWGLRLKASGQQLAADRERLLADSSPFSSLSGARLATRPIHLPSLRGAQLRSNPLARPARPTIVTAPMMRFNGDCPTSSAGSQ